MRDITYSSVASGILYIKLCGIRDIIKIPCGMADICRIFNDNNQYLGTFSAKIEIISQEISEVAQGQAAPKLQTSHKVHPVISPVSKPLKLGLEPEYTKRSKPSSTSHSDNIVVSTIQEQYQPDDGVSFPSSLNQRVLREEGASPPGNSLIYPKS
jgi:hypothetical protein